VTFYRYISLHELGTVWASGFKLYPLGDVHGRWSALGEFVCKKEIQMKAGILPHKDELTRAFSYNPETGELLHLLRKKGSMNGFLRKDGYIQVKLQGKAMLAHRVAWKIHHGDFDEQLQIDHINGVCHDNRIENLRISPSQVEQGQNKKVFKNNTSGYTGVGKSHNKWQARIMLNRKSISLGYFDTPEAANDARIKAKAELHTFNPIQRTS